MTTKNHNLNNDNDSKLKHGVRSLFQLKYEGRLREFYLRSANLLRERLRKDEYLYLDEDNSTYHIRLDKDDDLISISKDGRKIFIDRNNFLTIDRLQSNTYRILKDFHDRFNPYKNRRINLTAFNKDLFYDRVNPYIEIEESQPEPIRQWMHIPFNPAGKKRNDKKGGDDNE